MTISYFNTDAGYPEDDCGYSLSTIKSYEGYISANTAVRMNHTLAENGVEVASVSRQVRTGEGEYQTIAKGEYVYDLQGNETKETCYPDYETDGETTYVETVSEYNALGQLLCKNVEEYSEKNPEQNRNYTEESYTYDSFGNELTYTDVDGVVIKTTYDEETGEEKTVTEADGTAYASSGEEYPSEDGRKNMSMDNYGCFRVEIFDALGNTIREKDEKEGTWTEFVYDYGEDTDDGNRDENVSSTGELTEERVYDFAPQGQVMEKEEDGTITVNYGIGGKGKELLSGSRYAYDGYGSEIASAEFSGGGMDAEHCSSWILQKQTQTVKEGNIVDTSSTKVLDPATYEQVVYGDDYYTRFDDCVLSETITETVTDESGDLVSESTIVLCGGDKEETITTYEKDIFGTDISEYTIRRRYHNGKCQQTREIKFAYEYDDMGNITSETKQCRQGKTGEWETQTTRSVYDRQGNLIEYFTPQGIKEGYSTKYAYDLSGNLIREWKPVAKEDGDISYQLLTSEYDDAGNLTATEEQITGRTSSRTEYTYNELGSLTCIKNCLEDGTAQYTQYAYDVEGNKIRQFTGLTEPLHISLEEGKGEDAYSYEGLEYHVEVSGGNSKDICSETRYTYDGKNRLVAMTDPEGCTEKYSYDVYGNQTETVDRNGNTTICTYDCQGRVLSETATDKETGKSVSHTYSYDSYGHLVKKDDVVYTYDNLTGQVKTESNEAAGKKIKKEYTYDNGYNCTSFDVSVGGKTKLSLAYTYDGFSRLLAVDLQECKESGSGVTGNVARVASYTYDEDGSLATSEAGESGLLTTYAYDYAGNLTSMDNLDAQGEELSTYTASYHLNGQKVSEKEMLKMDTGKWEKRASAYSYDRLGRLLVQRCTGEEAVTYTYDAGNNRKMAVQGNHTTAYTYDKNNVLLRTDTLNTDTSEDTVTYYRYDKNGNQLATVNLRPTEEKGEVFDLDVSLGSNRLNDNVVNHYDASNQLVETLTGNKKVQYQYDADGVRTKKTVNGRETFYVWDGDQIVLELDEDGEVKKRYIRGTSLIFADKGQGTDKTYYVTNPHGDVVQLLDEEGTVIQDYKYDAFGNELHPEKKDDNPYRYSGEYYDRETNAIYLRARYYDPGLGRFLTRDTYTGEEDAPLSLHLYTYCENDGVNHVDPTGHWKKKTHEKITKEVLKRVKKYKNRYTRKYILQGCSYPDKAKNLVKNASKGKKVNIEVLGMVIAGGSGDNVDNKVTGMWHGRDYSELVTLKKRAKKKIKNPNKNKDKRAILLGCVFHAIQDKYAHSYCGELRQYLDDVRTGNHSYTEKSPEYIYHKDRSEFVNGKLVLKEIDKDEHEDYKDNENKDFNKETEEWETCSFDTNGRIQTAIDKGVIYLKRVME